MSLESCDEYKMANYDKSKRSATAQIWRNRKLNRIVQTQNDIHYIQYIDDNI